MPLFGKKRAEEKVVKTIAKSLLEQLRNAGYSKEQIQRLLRDLNTYEKLRRRGYTDEELRRILEIEEKTGRGFIAEAVIYKAAPELKEKILKDIEKHPEFSANEIAVFNMTPLDDKLREQIYSIARVTGKNPNQEAEIILKKIIKREEKNE